MDFIHIYILTKIHQNRWKYLGLKKFSLGQFWTLIGLKWDKTEQLKKNYALILIQSAIFLKVRFN